MEADRRTRRSSRSTSRRSIARWLEEKLDELDALVEAGETLELVGRLAAIVREPQRLGADAETGAANRDARLRDRLTATG